MASPPRWCLALLVGFAPAARGAEGVEVSGLFRAGELGSLELSTEGGRVAGRYRGGGACAELFEGQRVLEGAVEESVLVGHLTLCQTGAACGQKAYPVLVFYNSVDGVLTTDVKLDPACASPALKGSRLTFVPAGEERSPPKNPGSASQVAKKKLDPKKNLELQKQALMNGQRLLDAGDYAGAAEQFELGVSYNEANWTAHFGLGLAEFRKGDARRAIASYERARELAKEAKQEDPDLYYNLACAHSRVGDRKAALSSLRQAVKLGFALPEAMSADADLNRLLRDDPEFKKLVNQAWTLKDKSGKKGESKL
ncbi:MAG: tetratricopeptide repeat protein [Myxococcales bacterium]|nr:tetratricopeptide repeat protein [Myxococcales bacterium]